MGRQDETDAAASSAGMFREAAPARLDLRETSLVAGPNDLARPSARFRSYGNMTKAARIIAGVHGVQGEKKL